MSDSYLTRSSFKFGNVDMYERFGIRIAGSGLPEDILLPALRSRKVTIPERSGTYDFGAKYYDERGLSMTCNTIRTLSREDVREISYILSRKSEIRIWNEPDKYYLGRIYEAVDLTQIRRTANEFSLVFICDPFAYGQVVDGQFSGNVFVANYKGTAPTPTRVEITNTGNTNIVGIRVIQTDRREN